MSTSLMDCLPLQRVLGGKVPMQGKVDLYEQPEGMGKLSLAADPFNYGVP